MLKCTHICANFSLNTLLLQVQRAKSISICVNFPTISKNDSPTGYCENPNGWIQRLIKQVSIQKYEMYLKPFRRIYRRDCGMRRDWKSVGRCEQKAQNNGLKRLTKVPFFAIGEMFYSCWFSYYSIFQLLKVLSANKMITSCTKCQMNQLWLAALFHGAICPQTKNIFFDLQPKIDRSST